MEGSISLVTEVDWGSHQPVGNRDDVLDGVVACRTQRGGSPLPIGNLSAPYETCPFRAHVQRLQVGLVPGVMPTSVFDVMLFVHFSLLLSWARG